MDTDMGVDTCTDEVLETLLLKHSLCACWHRLHSQWLWKMANLVETPAGVVSNLSATHAPCYEASYKCSFVSVSPYMWSYMGIAFALGVSVIGTA